MEKENKLQIRNSTAEFLIFTRQAGEDGIEVRVADETVWLTQNLIGVLFMFVSVLFSLKGNTLHTLNLYHCIWYDLCHSRKEAHLMGHAILVRGGLTLMMVFIHLFLVSAAARAEFQVLAQDTALTVQGYAQKGANVLFAGGTAVLLNDEKQVQNGTLAKDTALVVPGMETKVAFCRKTRVNFSRTGHVEKGIMTANQELKIEGSSNTLKFRGNLPISFGSTGVSAGYTAEEALLSNPENYGKKEKYPANTYVMFDILGGVYVIEPPHKKPR
jgi:hypothetical protein